MIQERDSSRLQHMLFYARQAVTLLGDREAAALENDLRTLLAVVYAVQIVGEAASKTSMDLRQAHPEIAWAPVIRMRHVLVHDYFEIKAEVVVETVHADLPPLIRALETLLGEGPRP
jgi:uncharacterized protein with HEPN domain